jgi:hypothetical protein
MKRALGLSLAVAFAISAISAPALAGEKGNAYGHVIKSECGKAYGQLWKEAKAAGGHMKPAGAKGFVEDVLPHGGCSL